MGSGPFCYKVRFGILEAGAYGVSQSRKRAFIWAASPEETLPDWPQPMHVFAGPDLKISLPGNVQYAAVGSTMGGAPFRPITVRDIIGDLPSVRNGASEAMIEDLYGFWGTLHSFDPGLNNRWFLDLLQNKILCLDFVATSFRRREMAGRRPHSSRQDAEVVEAPGCCISAPDPFEMETAMQQLL